MTVSAVAHLVVAGLAIAWPKTWRWGAAALALDHLLFFASSCLPHGRWLGPVISALPPDDNLSQGPDIVLTFDDGPDLDVTSKVAEILEDHGVRATFFMIGERAARHPQLVKRLHDAGHRIENHTASHPSNFAFSFLPRLGREIGSCQRTIERITGRAPAYFRAPAGMRNPLLEGALGRQGLELVSWTRRAYDTVDGDPERVLRRLVSDLRRGDILLLHDGNAARSPTGQPVCLEILPRLLDRIAAAGLEAGPLPDPRA